MAGLAQRLAGLEAAAEDARPALTVARAQDAGPPAPPRRAARLDPARSPPSACACLSEDDGEGEEAGQSSRDPEELRAQAAEVREQEEALRRRDRRGQGRPRGGRRSPAPRPSRQPRGGDSSGSPRAARAAADRREGLAKLGGQVGAKASRIEAARGRDRAPARRPSSRRRRAPRRPSASSPPSRPASREDEEGEEGLDTAYEQAAADLEQPRPSSSALAGGRARRGARPDDCRRPGRGPRAQPAPQGRRRRAARRRRRPARHRRLGGLARQRRPAGSRTRSPPPSGWAGEALAVELARRRGPRPDHPARRRRRAREPARRGVRELRSTRPTWPALARGARWARDVVECARVGAPGGGAGCSSGSPSSTMPSEAAAPRRHRVAASPP